MDKKQFKGVIKLDVHDSKPDWGPYTPTKAPTGAPNILFVLYDDTGLAAWSPFGGRSGSGGMTRWCSTHHRKIGDQGAVISDPKGKSGGGK